MKADALTKAEKKWLAAADPATIPLVNNYPPEMMRELYPDVLAYPPEFQESMDMQEKYIQKILGVGPDGTKPYVRKLMEFGRRTEWSRISLRISEETIRIQGSSKLDSNQSRFHNMQSRIMNNVRSMKTQMIQAGWKTDSSAVRAFTYNVPSTGMFWVLAGEGTFRPRTELERLRREMVEPTRRFLHNFIES